MLLREYAIEWWFVFPPHLTNVSALSAATRKREKLPASKCCLMVYQSSPLCCWCHCSKRNKVLQCISRTVLREPCVDVLCCWKEKIAYRVWRLTRDSILLSCWDILLITQLGLAVTKWSFERVSMFVLKQYTTFKWKHATSMFPQAVQRH